MASLIETDVLADLLPVACGATALVAVDLGRVTSVMPFRGQSGAAGDALGKLGLGWPGPGQSLTAEGRAILWTGRGQAFLLGADPAPLAGLAALTDQGDAWAVMRLEGAGAASVLARLVPLDLRPEAFPEGAVARSGLNHVMAIFRRVSEGIEIWVFRSMAATAVHELTEAMARVAARG